MKTYSKSAKRRARRQGRNRDVEAQRHPNGSVIRTNEPSPLEAKRMEVFGITRSAARQDAYGSRIGLMLANGEITPDQSTAAIWFAVARRDYLKAIKAPNDGSNAWAMFERVRETGDRDTSRSDRRDVETWRVLEIDLANVHPTAIKVLNRTIMYDEEVRPSDRSIWLCGLSRLVELMRLTKPKIQCTAEMHAGQTDATGAEAWR